jgi:Peptidase propeptide and YPEB domain
MIRLPVPPKLLAACLLILWPACCPALSASAEFCAHAPQSQWLSIREVEQSLKEAGYTMLSLKITENRCFAVTARDKAGESHALVLHPVSAQQMSGAVKR